VSRGQREEDINHGRHASRQAIVSGNIATLAEPTVFQLLAPQTVNKTNFFSRVNRPVAKMRTCKGSGSKDTGSKNETGLVDLRRAKEGNVGTHRSYLIILGT